MFFDKRSINFQALLTITAARFYIYIGYKISLQSENITHDTLVPMKF